MRRRSPLVGAALAAALVLAACGTDSGTPENQNVINVPGDAPTIQAAVDMAVPGDLILVEEGVYAESVTVDVDNIVIRGVDRNKVILDGEGRFGNGIRVAGANGVAIENMTARDYQQNGFYWTEAVGYRASYLTAVRNGLYGIYAFDAEGGVIEHSYASGHPDAGFYIGQCDPCDAVIRDSIAEYNGLGYSGTNASNNLYIIDNVFRHNNTGIMPNSGDYEKRWPQSNTVFAGNLVHSNNGPAPGLLPLLRINGHGILISGGLSNTVVRNRVFDHAQAGIGVIANFMGRSFPSNDNVIEGNHVSRSGVADLVLSATETARNCFVGNTATTAQPTSLLRLTSCAGTPETIPADGAYPIDEVLDRKTKTQVRRKDVADPPPQPNMPDARTAPAIPASRMPPTVNLDEIALPDAP